MILLVGVVALVVGGSIFGLNPSNPRLPDPNGYDDLDQAGASFQGRWSEERDLSRADLAEVRALVLANAVPLARARIGLGRESMVRCEDTRDGLSKHYESISRIRTVARLFEAESVVRQADGRFVEAARSYRDELALGQAMTQGGLGVDAMTGWSVQKRAIDGLRKIEDQLPIETIRLILRELESLDRRRIRLDAVGTRWARWFHGSNNLWERTIYRWSGMEKKGRTDELALARQGRDKLERDMRFLLAELAIRAYQEDRHAWPRSVEALVPAYLSAVPIDPGTGRPIDYPANAAGELTGDLGSVARPDGEVAAPRP